MEPEQAFRHLTAFQDKENHLRYGSMPIFYPGIKFQKIIKLMSAPGQKISSLHKQAAQCPHFAYIRSIYAQTEHKEHEVRCGSQSVGRLLSPSHSRKIIDERNSKFEANSTGKVALRVRKHIQEIIGTRPVAVIGQ